MQKDLIKTRFKKSIKTYNDNAFVQKRMAKTLADTIGEGHYDNVLELGCGTGFLTDEIIKQIVYKNYYAVDFVEDCGKYISDISKDIHFICEDLENLEISKYKPNLVVSNAAIQWVEDIPEFINKIMSGIEPDGVFAFTIFGKNNFHELGEISSEYIPLRYYSVDELETILKKYPNKTIKEETVKLKFNTPNEVLHHIKNTGVNGIRKVHWTKSDLINFEKKYAENCGEDITLTYHPIYIKISSHK